jgi:hypothetical protein
MTFLICDLRFLIGQSLDKLGARRGARGVGPLISADYRRRLLPEPGAWRREAGLARCLARFSAMEKAVSTGLNRGKPG